MGVVAVMTMLRRLQLLLSKAAEVRWLNAYYSLGGTIEQGALSMPTRPSRRWRSSLADLMRVT